MIPAPDWMLIDAVRYAIGRQSYQVGVTCRWLAATWAQIPADAKEIIRRDVEEAFQLDDRDREDGSQYKYLGMDMDRREWEKVRALWRETTA